MASIENIAKVIPTGVKLTPTERDAVLEIAALAVATDKKIHEDEEAALRAIAARIGGDRKTVDALLGGASSGQNRDVADKRLRELAAKLPGVGARELAYKAAYAVSLADLASSDEEFEFDLELIDALALSQDDADRLSAEVIQALSPEGD